MDTQVTCSGPSASAAISATSAESIPPGERRAPRARSRSSPRSRAARCERARRPRRRSSRIGASSPPTRSAGDPRPGSPWPPPAPRARPARRPALAAHVRPVAGVAQAGGRHLARDRSWHSASDSSNCGARASTVAVGVDGQAVAVEDELVLAAHGVHEHDRGQVVHGALDEHPLALRALVRGGRGRRRGSRSAARRPAPRTSPAGPGSQMSSQIERPTGTPFSSNSRRPRSRHWK